MTEANGALAALGTRIAELAQSGGALEDAYARLGVKNEDIAVIVEQTRKSTVTYGDIEKAFSEEDREHAAKQIAMLLHRLNNHLTGALSIASLAREDAKDKAAVAALDDLENAGRSAAEAVRRLNEALKR